MCFKTVYGPALLQNKQQAMCKQVTTAQVQHFPVIMMKFVNYSISPEIEVSSSQKIIYLS
jgi:hypothetical protein